ncbi:MAG: hypothetical protein JO167_07255 [Alphaproteobacteria bacterium]|nr:hypothetical protein [Alphaproteobacteria bacterium]MBV9904100.1 hypothetical protein [Alphaproteobacteria bacterium]
MGLKRAASLTTDAAIAGVFCVLRSHVDDTATILHALAEPLLVLSYERQVRFANAAAEGLLCARQGLLLQGDVLAGDNVDLHGRLTDAVLGASAASTGTAFCFLLRPRDDGRCAVMHLVRLDRSPSAECQILARVCMNDVPQPADGDQLRLAFGLSQSECDIAMLMMAGLSPRAIATRRNSSQDTVRWHIRNLFSKTYTTRLADLVLQLSAARSPFHAFDSNAADSPLLRSLALSGHER